MITKRDLKDLANKRFLDAKVLISKGRYQGCLYLGGYTVELLLKYNICKIFKFTNGFPESKNEFSGYKSKVKKQFINVTSIRDFKTHDLPKLLTYSGKEYDIKALALLEWDTIKTWNPEFRYKNQIIRKQNATNILNCIEKIKGILLS